LSYSADPHCSSLVHLLPVSCICATIRVFCVNKQLVEPRSHAVRIARRARQYTFELRFREPRTFEPVRHFGCILKRHTNQCRSMTTRVSTHLYSRLNMLWPLRNIDLPGNCHYVQCVSIAGWKYLKKTLEIGAGLCM
jgi:hypothetical protein